MIALLSGLNATKNLWLAGILVILGGVIVTGIYQAGARSERNKDAAETAELNTKLAALRAEHRVSTATEAEKAKETDAKVTGSLKQQCILTEETAVLLGRVR